MHNFNIGYGGIYGIDRGSGTAPAMACAYRAEYPRYGALSLCVGLIPGQGRSALVRLSWALVVDMGVCLAAQRGIYPDRGNIMHCISYPATIRHIRATIPIEAHSTSHRWNYTVKGTKAL